MSIRERLDKHERIALSFSGGKDSTACLYLLRSYLDRITVYHLDTGDLLPEIVERVAQAEKWIPNFIRIETNVRAWIAVNGLPSDLLPYHSHVVGQAMEEHPTRLVARYHCCWENLMAPVYQRVRDDGNTMLIRGTKRVDMRRLPAEDGRVLDGMELYLPIQEWSNERVRAYLARQGVSLPRLYDKMINAPECARCSAWWGEGRAAYLRQWYPELYRDYDARLQLVIDAVAGSLANLRREAGVS